MAHCFLVVLAASVIAGVTVSAQQVLQRELDHFILLNQLRATGFTCPGGQSFAPNSDPLRFDCRLWRASQLHSQDMADQGYFSHTSLDGRTFVDRARAQGISPNAENIAAGRGTAEAVLEQWKGSDGHCTSMMNPARRLFAVGYGSNSASPFRHYWTQMFKNLEVLPDESCLDAAASSTLRATGTATATGTTVTATTTTATTDAARVEGTLVLNVSGSPDLSGDGAARLEAALVAAIAELAGVGDGAVAVTLTLQRRLQAGGAAPSLVTAAFTITVPADGAAATAQRIVSVGLESVTAVLARHLRDAGLDGDFQAVSLSADVAASGAGDDAALYMLLLGAAAGGVCVLAAALCCCCCVYCCRRRKGEAEPQAGCGQQALPVLLTMEEGLAAHGKRHAPRASGGGPPLSVY